MRSAYGESLVNLGKKYPNIVCVGGDTTDSLKTKKFGEMFPDRLFNVGIAEANLVSIAAGLAIAGKISFASTYAAFIPGRCLDQIRNAICYPNLDVKIVVSHAGLSVGPDGASHQQIEDISIMRSLPNMRVLVPADAPSVKKLLENIMQIAGPFYVRLARPSTEELYPEETDFEIGKGKVFRIMLDNFTPEQCTEAVKIIGEDFETEASGGINLDTIQTYAATGVDYVSVGGLIHQAKSLDLSLKAVVY